VKSLFVTSEVAGLAKGGGLEEASAGLPPALRQRGIDARVLMPAYHEVIAKPPNVNRFGDLPGRAFIPAARIGRDRLVDGMRGRARPPVTARWNPRPEARQFDHPGHARSPDNRFNAFVDPLRHPSVL
jgi:hypothetical protein